MKTIQLELTAIYFLIKRHLVYIAAIPLCIAGKYSSLRFALIRQHCVSRSVSGEVNQVVMKPVFLVQSVRLPEVE